MVYYLSTVYLVDIKIIDKNEYINVVVKTPSNIEDKKNLLTVREQFYNEVLFYNKVAVNSDVYLQLPKCFYAYNNQEDYQDGMIIMENIASLGYAMCPDSYNIPFEYVISGVQEVARFHGMGYSIKTRDPDNFFTIVSEIKSAFVFLGCFFPVYMNLISMRPIKWLREQNYDEEFCNKMEHYMKNAYQYFILDLNKPIEPLAVICHGDFTINNILFRKTNGVIDSRLIDFAMMRYASPSTDLSTFLYFSVSKNDRKERFNEIFKAYHDALIKYLNDENIKIMDCFSYDNLLADYKHHVMFGYIMALFFIPNILGLIDLAKTTFDNDTDPLKVFEKTENLGGENLSKLFAEMLIDIRELGGLDHLEDL
ncbi:uncharacterized protein LOC122856177 [Aphidius gifuensis]|uniref:uncharacterized protein LOC122856177 n=1 Tax=Aphidius gifuensis TaxID=684658 RepID=UPI001CDC4907|nr:uncharacterized protein LOC122856177 [Aphidius gifuensis]